MTAAAVLRVEVHLNHSTSLKAKRQVLRHLLDTARVRYRVAAAEVAGQDLWQRAEIAFAAVASDAGHVGEVLDAVERFVWSHPELDVVSATRHWLDTEA